jgi:hypothetical protein
VDFTCLFFLFHGNERIYKSDLTDNEEDWRKATSNRFKSKPFYLRNFPEHLKGKPDGISRRSVAIKPDLSILHQSATLNQSAQDPIIDKSVIPTRIKIGGFSFSEGSGRVSNSPLLPLQFGRNAVKQPLIFHEDFSLDTMQDLIQAGYTPSGLIWYIQNFKIACTRCISLGHLNIHCKNQIRCMGCLKFGHMKKDCIAPIIPGQSLYPESKEDKNVRAKQDESFNKLVSAKLVVPRIPSSKQTWVKQLGTCFCVRCLMVGTLRSHVHLPRDASSVLDMGILLSDVSW